MRKNYVKMPKIVINRVNRSHLRSVTIGCNEPSAQPRKQRLRRKRGDYSVPDVFKFLPTGNQYLVAAQGLHEKTRRIASVILYREICHVCHVFVKPIYRLAQLLQEQKDEIVPLQDGIVVGISSSSR